MLESAVIAMRSFPVCNGALCVFVSNERVIARHTYLPRLSHGGATRVSPATVAALLPPPFCHSLPSFSAVNLRFGHASFVGKMRDSVLSLQPPGQRYRAREIR